MFQTERMRCVLNGPSIRVKARSRGGGELLVMDVGLAAHDIALGCEAKGKRAAKARLLDKGFYIRCM